MALDILGAGKIYYLNFFKAYKSSGVNFDVLYFSRYLSTSS